MAYLKTHYLLKTLPDIVENMLPKFWIVALATHYWILSGIMGFIIITSGHKLETELIM